MRRLTTEGKKLEEVRREVEEEASQVQSDRAKPKKRRRGRRRGGKGTERRKGREGTSTTDTHTGPIKEKIGSGGERKTIVN